MVGVKDISKKRMYTEAISNHHHHHHHLAPPPPPPPPPPLYKRIYTETYNHHGKLPSSPFTAINVSDCFKQKLKLDLSIHANHMLKHHANFF